ncbi:hypothetical protein [Neobacillus sp. Marseille-QA0830]
MDSSNSRDLLLQQGKNVLTSMKDLLHAADKKGKARSDLYEKFCANLHSFNVYTYMDPSIEQMKEVQIWIQKLESFSAIFAEVSTDFEVKIDVKSVETTYQDILTEFNKLDKVLGF